ncbi:MAG: metallophosphoesterase family protein, partial [Planctomycetota bacterium]|nr:metallophosphoesterase family protein [Planctomycetota bacterium]
MEPIAVISDVHSNLEALTAVLDDISTRQIKEIICLGDVVGYG